MITEIGIVAGEIWNFLDTHGEAELDQLITGVGKTREVVLMSLGWLARNGHVVVEYDSDTYKISLRNPDKTAP